MANVTTSYYAIMTSEFTFCNLMFLKVRGGESAFIVARLRARKWLNAELGLDRLDLEMSDTCIAMCEAEDAIGELAPSPNVVAAMVLAGVCDGCDRSDFAEGNGYCGTMAVALVSLRGLLPGLSGLIREHAALLSQQSDAAAVGHALRAGLILKRTMPSSSKEAASVGGPFRLDGAP